MAIDRTGISSLDTGASDITYTGDEGPKSPEQQLMASADPMLVEEYEKYVFEIEEQGQTPMSFKEFVQQIMSGMADGGIANPRLMPHTGSDLLVSKNLDGTRPKYQPPGGGATSLGSGRDYSGSDRGPRDDPDRHGHTPVQNVHQTGAVTQTPGRTVIDPRPGGGDPGMTYTRPPVIPSRKDVWNVGMPSNTYNPAVSAQRNRLFDIRRKQRENYNKEKLKMKERVDDWFETPSQWQATGRYDTGFGDTDIGKFSLADMGIATPGIADTDYTQLAMVTDKQKQQMVY